MASRKDTDDQKVLAVLPRVQRRREFVESHYSNGRSVDDIHEMVEAEFGEVKRRNIENDIHLIRESWRRRAEELFAGDVHAWWLQVAMQDRLRAIEAGELKLAYQILKDIAKLAGVDLADLVIRHESEGEKTVRSWLDLMMEERERKNLPADTYREVEGRVESATTHGPNDRHEEPPGSGADD